MAVTLDINFSGKRRITASPMTIVYYDEEFSTEKRTADALEDFLSVIIAIEQDNTINAIKIMRLVWACEKTYKNGMIESFPIWSRLLSNIEFDDVDMIKELVGAIKGEFFRKQANEEPTTTEEEKDEVSD